MTAAGRTGLALSVDIYEPRDFSSPGPAGCNMCGGIISESLVQLLSAEGIVLPGTVVQRGIDSYVLHTDAGSVRIDPPRREKRIAAVHRGSGPRGDVATRWESFDAHLLGLAGRAGARIVRERVEGIALEDGFPRIRTRSGLSDPCDLVAGTTGINTAALKIFEGLGIGYRAPEATKTYICEFVLGRETIERTLGNSMHVFLLDLPRLEFAAIIPKGECATVCLLGTAIDKPLVDAFLSSPEVRGCFPDGWAPPPDFCRCSPAINVRGAETPFADRFVFIGDCGVNRLYKDGIGGAYRMAKAAAMAAVFDGVSAEAFREGYLPACRKLARDNDLGRVVFGVTGLIRKIRPARRGLVRMTASEQRNPGRPQRLSGVLWDTFTGSAPYTDVFRRTLDPRFIGRMLAEIAAGFFSNATCDAKTEGAPKMGELGKVYAAGEAVIRQGDPGDCMYVIQSGQVEVVREADRHEFRLAVLSPGDFFGEMALFERDRRSATVRALGEVRVLTIDQGMFLRKIRDDPSLAFRIMEKMSNRIRELDAEVARLTRPGPDPG
ncbi:MAG TPA: cyclic nucleotide-binding domain-containing protein [Candidatus Deferrimicrobiaceae bacterium]